VMARCAAVDFIILSEATLRARLRRYIRNPEVAVAAREDFRKRVAWWRMTLGRV
jgi:hypothetical protein